MVKHFASRRTLATMATLAGLLGFGAALHGILSHEDKATRFGAAATLLGLSSAVFLIAPKESRTA